MNTKRLVVVITMLTPLFALADPEPTGDRLGLFASAGALSSPAGTGVGHWNRPSQVAVESTTARLVDSCARQLSKPSRTVAQTGQVAWWGR